MYGGLREAYKLEVFQDLHEIHKRVVGVDMTKELPEQELLFRYIRGDAKVLEFGGNIGRSSIVISKLLDNPQDHVVLESDPKIAAQLEKNRRANGCGFVVVNAALSETPIIQKGWNAAPVVGVVHVGNDANTGRRQHATTGRVGFCPHHHVGGAEAKAPDPLRHDCGGL